MPARERSVCSVESRHEPPSPPRSNVRRFRFPPCDSVQRFGSWRKRGAEQSHHLGVIGLGSQGTVDLRAFLTGTRAICDIDTAVHSNELC